MQYKIFIPAAIGLILIGTLYISTKMLGFSQEYMDYLIKIVNETPSKFDDWTGVDNGKVSENEKANEAILKESGALAQISRVYENPFFEERINLYFISGVSFRVAMHSPEACYPGSGFEEQGEKQTFDFDYVYTDSKTGKKYARKATFYTAVFKKGDYSERVFWAWNDGSGWEAPGIARIRYSGHIPLCKCYFSYVENHSNHNNYNNTFIVDFATRFLSDLDNRMIVNGELPTDAIKVKLGEEMTGSQVNIIKPQQSVDNVTPLDLPSNVNIESSLKNIENLNE